MTISKLQKNIDITIAKSCVSQCRIAHVEHCRQGLLQRHRSGGQKEVVVLCVWIFVTRSVLQKFAQNTAKTHPFKLRAALVIPLCFISAVIAR